MLSYAQALRAILSRADFERDRHTPYPQRDWRLARVEEFLSQLGNPHLAYPTIHVAGTKGKGSVTAMMDSVLRAAGYRVGMYTSPHLHSFRERIRLQGELITEDQVVSLTEAMQPIMATRPMISVFELITAMAMWHFEREKVDLAVFEVGLGGRLDATNVIEPLVSVITSISIDHISVLGSSLAEIAREKAGIVKPGVPVVSSPQRPPALRVIRETAEARGSDLTLAKRHWRWRALGATDGGQRVSIYRVGHHDRPEYPDLWLPLLGEFQLENACTTVAAAEVLRSGGLRIPRDAIYEGLADVRWLGRMQVLSRAPLLVVDGAHNPYSIRKLLESLPRYIEYERIQLVFGAGRSHRPGALLELLLPSVTKTHVTQADHPKAAPGELLRDMAQELGYEAELYGATHAALQGALAQAGEQDLILVTGSLFVVAEAMSAWHALRNLPPFPQDPDEAY